MGLSNTAIPKYYGMFREAVRSGRIPIPDTIVMEMNRIDDLIRDPTIYYDPAPVEGYIKFCENELTLANGEPLHLLDSFKLWAEQVYGWYYFSTRTVYEPTSDNHGGRYVQKTVKIRLVNKQYLIVGRGASKSMYAETIQAHTLINKKRTTYGIVTAPTMAQAECIMSPLKTAILRAKGPLFKFLTHGSINNTTGSKVSAVKLASTKKGIENLLTNSIIAVHPMSIDKLQGYRQDIATVDEWLSGDIREDVIGALEQSGSKNDDYLIISTSSEGTVRNGVGDSIKMELMKILKGEYINPNVSIWWYKLDDIKEVNNPETWLKANPNLGVTVSYDAYQKDVERAEQSISARNDILAKRFGIPLEGYTYFFSYDEIQPSQKRLNFWKMNCSLGMDLSQGDDFCAFLFLFPLPNGGFGVKTRCYITSHTMNKVLQAMRLKYYEFMKEGSLQVLEGAVLDMMDVYDDLDAFMEQSQYNVCAVGYDPYNAKDFIERWSKEHGPYWIEMVRQGAKTESVPLGDIKNLAQQRMLLFDEQLMSFAMGNAITLEDTNGNRKLWKKRYDQKIDPVAALIDAYVAYKVNRDNFE